jgi:hypothetical protein
MFPNCPTPLLKNYTFLRGYPTKKFDHISANSKQNPTCESGPKGVLFDEKNRGSKISWHCPFKPTHFIVLLIFSLSFCHGIDWGKTGEIAASISTVVPVSVPVPY